MINNSTRTLQEYLSTRYVEDIVTGCWNWVRAKDRDGYGTCIGNKWAILHKKQRAHQLAYINKYGAVLGKLCVCHTCDNPSCINPDHLFLGTPKDNIDDMVKKGRANRPKGSKQAKAKLHENDIPSIRNLRGKFSSRIVAKVFGVNQNTIMDVWHNKTWKHLHEDQVS